MAESYVHTALKQGKQFMFRNYSESKKNCFHYNTLIRRLEILLLFKTTEIW